MPYEKREREREREKFNKIYDCVPAYVCKCHLMGNYVVR